MEVANPDSSRAVLIGTASYARMEPLPSIRANLDDLHETLTDPDIWGLPPENVTVIIDQDEPKKIYRALRAAAAATRADGMLVVYYAGHGLPHAPDLVLALPDTDPHYPDDEGIQYPKIREAARLSVALRRLVILDCCYAGRAGQGVLADGNAARQLANEAEIEHACLLLAVGANRPAMAPPGERNTAFTGALLHVLRTGFEAPDQVLTVRQITEITSRRLVAAGFARPELRESNSAGDMVLVHNVGVRAQPPVPVGLPLPGSRKSGSASDMVLVDNVLVPRRDLTGTILAAAPEVTDPELQLAVILVLRHNALGAIGVRLNRPTEARPPGPDEWRDLITPPARLFDGGPVARYGFIALVRLRSDQDVPIRFTEVKGLLGSLPLTDSQPWARDRIADMRVFRGYLGWGPSTLDHLVGTGLLRPVDTVPARPVFASVPPQPSVETAVASTERPPAPAESALTERLLDSDRAGQRVTLVVGSGLGDQAMPGEATMIAVAERFASGRDDDGDLAQALLRARDEVGDRSLAVVRDEYRRVLAGWLSDDELNAIEQQTVLQRYRPQDPPVIALGNHGLWQPITLRLGEELENDTESWELSPSMRALGALLTRRADLFGGQVLTTTVDPSLEIAIRRAGGRAVSLVATDADPSQHLDNDVIAVYHLHGFWRPLRPGASGRLSEEIGTAEAFRIGRAAARLFRGDMVCVLGSSDRTGTIRAILTSAGHRPAVAWALHRPPGTVPAPNLPPDVPLEQFGPVDNARLLPELARQFAVPVPSGPTRTTQVHHPVWERLFVSQPDSEAPAAIPDLIHELERRFAWKVDWADREPRSETPTLVYWPVRLRRRTSVIHMVQAFTAGALAARGAQVVVSLDDLSMTDGAAVRPGFVADLRRWITHVAPGAEPQFVSLLEFLDDSADSTANDALLRPTDPWSVARDFYGRPLSLYAALAAVKALPPLAPDELEASAAKVVQNLQLYSAGRILTPMTMWAYLHHLLLANPSSSLITLGGRDEGLLWEQWRQIYGLGVSQLYNPRIKGLTHESGMVRWQSADELARQLDRLRELQAWDDEGRYTHWLFQNALLLPIYLTRGGIPRVGGHTLDSWAAFATALKEGAPVLDTLAGYATELYCGP